MRINIFFILLLLTLQLSAQTNNGTISADGSYSADVPAPFSGNTYSVNLNGTKKISFQTPCYWYASSGGAISIWFKVSSFTGGTFGDPLFGYTTSSTPCITISSSTGIKIKSYVGEQTIFAVPAMSTNTWYNLIINRITNGATHVYLNGIESSTGAVTHSGDYFMDVLGDWWQYGSYFNGKVCEFSKFDNSLSATDISNLAAGAAPVTSSSLHWKMNEGSGTTVNDSQAGGYGSGTDAAQAFITAAGITDNTQKNAIIQLVADLKNAGIWAKMKAIYPFVGGDDAVKHSFNLKNPLQYRLTFYGTWSHSINGSDPDGSTAYATTGLIPSTDLILNNTHLSFYSREEVSAPVIEMGCLGNSLMELAIYNDVLYSDQYHYSDGRLMVPNTNSKGLFVGSRTSASSHAVYKDGVSLATTTSSGGNLPNLQIYIGARNENGVAMYHTNRQFAFSSIGEGLTAAEVTSLNTAVAAYLNNLQNTSIASTSQWITSNNNIYYDAGAVGIGTGATQMGGSEYKLFVRKGIRTEKLKVDVPNTTWPDFVFDKKYKLPSLPDLKKYIEANKHLPGVIPAHEAEKNGIDIGSNQALLLQKIEELTLLLIQQNEMNEKQNKKIQQLELHIKNNRIK